jgi:hypothetical protein
MVAGEEDLRMSHPSRHRTRHGRRTPPAPKPWLDVLMAEWALAWAWAADPVRRLFRAAIREGIRPPTSFDGLPPGQFPPIDAIKDELFGRPRPRRGTAAPFRVDAAPGTHIPPRDDHPGVR